MCTNNKRTKQLTVQYDLHLATDKSDTFDL